MHLVVIICICLWQFAMLKSLNISVLETIVEAVTSIAMINIFSFLIASRIWFGENKNHIRYSIRFLLAMCFMMLITLITVGIQYFIVIHAFPYDVHYINSLENMLPWRIVMWLMAYGLMTTFFANIHIFEEYEKKRDMETALREKLKEAELKSLRAQINPHFLFNSLNSLSSLTILDPERANEMVLKISEYLRYMLSHEGTEIRRFSDELKNIDRYIEISKVRFGSKLRYSTEISADAATTGIPFMILQPIIENAIKYGVSANPDVTELKISANVSDNTLIIKISNNYVEVPKEDEEGLGIGLKNIRERLKLYYGKDDLMTIEETENLYIVLFKIPQNLEINNGK